MSLDAVNIALEGHFTDAWELGSNTPIAYLNVDFDSAGVDEWVRFAVYWEDARQSSIGNECRENRFYGSVLVQIYTPVNLGMKRQYALSDEVINILSSKRVGGAVLSAASARTLGQAENWQQTNVQCTFYYDQQVAGA